jgi:ribosome-binding factor A
MSRRAGAPTAARRYPRATRVNHLLQQVIATELERLGADDPRLALVTVMGVEVEGDLRHAKVWVSSLSDDAAEALADDRIRLQAAIAQQVRLKRTPLLAFAADPAVATGARVEEIIRQIGPLAPDEPPDELPHEPPDEAHEAPHEAHALPDEAHGAHEAPDEDDKDRPDHG